MDNKLKIPKVINVGFQKREGTYTGRLAYVVYTDEKGVLRKERSWEYWRDKKIAAEEFPNDPTSGFVLNKGVGGARQSWGWNARNEYIRVYDPRGFEFEISVANLLFILTECTATKGKGLEGEFVYAWDKSELVLLPVDCFEYRSSKDFTALQTKKVTKAEMKEGRTYQHKSTEQLVYMGRHKVRRLSAVYGMDHTKALLAPPTRAMHAFWNMTTEKWQFEDGFTKLAGVLSEDSHPDFADLHSKFMDSEYVSTKAKLVLAPITLKHIGAPTYWGNQFYIKVDGGYQLVFLANTRERYHWNMMKVRLPEGQSDNHFWPVHPVIVKEVTIASIEDSRDRGYTHHDAYHTYHAVSASYLAEKELFTPEIKLPNQTIGISNYVQRRKNQSVS